MAKRVRTTTNSKTSNSSDGADRDAELHDLTIAPLPQQDEGFVDESAATRVATRSRGATVGGATQTQQTGEMNANGKGKGVAAPGAQAGANGGGASATDNKHVMLPAFLSKTFEIFSMQEFATICGWNASGDTIIVSQLEAFVALVLPRFFKHRNFPSFVRQLNLYGFHKTVLDSKRLEFQHPYFKRDRPDLLHYIKRKVSSGSSSSQQQQLVNTTAQNSRLEAHREISDNLLREMKELRQRSENMEKRLRELEIDNAIVRSDNLKLWKHLETAKDKQLIMQEKLKKIMWILFQIYRGKQGIPKLSSNDATNVISEDYINSSMLGPKEFREVLRYLAMDEPPLLPRSSSSGVEVPTQGSRKRKFVEVPSDNGDQFGNQLYKLDPSILQVGSPLPDNSSAMTVASNPPPPAASVDSNNNVLSIFSPNASGPRTEFSNSDLNALIANAMSSTLTNYNNAAAAAAAGNSEQRNDFAVNDDGSVANQQQLDLLDDDLPLLSDSESYNFGEGEEQVMKKLEDFETSLLDEYDVGCLDTLLQQLKNSSMVKPSSAAAGVSVIDPEEIFVGGPDEGSPRNA